MQNAQAKYYQLVHDMLRKGEIDEEVLEMRKASVLQTLEKAQNDLGADTVELATSRYQEVITGLTSRLESVWTPEERTSQEDKRRTAQRIDSLLSMRLS